MTVHYQASGPVVFNLGAATIPWPPHLTGDIGVLVVQSANQTVAAPDGWTRIGSEQGTGTGGAAGATLITAFWKRAASAAEADVVVADTGDHQTGIIYTVRGALASGDILDGTAGDVDAVGGTAATIPGPTTTVDGCLVCAIVANGTDSSTNQIQSLPGLVNANLETLTRRDAITNGATVVAALTQTATGVGGGFTLATGRMVTAGNVDDTTATLANSSLQGRLSFAIQPEPEDASTVVINRDNDMDIRQAGSTDQSVLIHMVTTADGLPDTGVADSDITQLHYVRQNAAPVSFAAANLAAIDSAHFDGGWEEYEATDAPGDYRLDLPDAAVVAGVPRVKIIAQTATSRGELTIDLTADNPRAAALDSGDIEDASETGAAAALTAFKSEDFGGLTFEELISGLALNFAVVDGVLSIKDADDNELFTRALTRSALNAITVAEPE